MAREKKALLIGGSIAMIALVALTWLVLATKNPVGNGYRAASGFDQTNLWLQVSGWVLSLVGFAFALMQIAKVRSATEAARDNAVVGTFRIRANQLMFLLPQIQATETEFDIFLKHNDSFNAQRALARWREGISQADGILSKMGPEQTELSEVLTKALESARGLKVLLQKTKSTNLGSVAAGPQSELSAATDLLARVVGQFATQVPQGEQV